MAREHNWLDGVAYGVALLMLIFAAAFWQSEAHAGTNVWTVSHNQASCGAAASISAASLASCDLAIHNAAAGSTSCHLGIENPVMGGTLPNLTFTAQFYTTGSYNDVYGDPHSCGHVLAENVSYSFTEACSTIGKEYDASQGGCDDPDDCSAMEGDEHESFYMDMGPLLGGCSAGPGGEDFNCAVQAIDDDSFCLDGECFGRYAYTGDACGDIDVPATGENKGTDCVNSGVVSYCSTAGKNCGTLNGNYVCLESVPDGNCSFLGNRGMVCAGAGPHSGAPTEEDGETPAEADGEFESGKGGDGEMVRGFKYFSPATVAASGSPTRGGDAGDTGEEDDDDPEPGECDEPGACEGVLPELTEAETFGEATSGFMGRVQAAPIVEAAMSIGTSIPAGECPSPTVSIEYISTTLTLDAHCDLWPDIAAVISAVMLAIWVLLGVRILMSA